MKTIQIEDIKFRGKDSLGVFSDIISVRILKQPAIYSVIVSRFRLQEFKWVNFEEYFFVEGEEINSYNDAEEKGEKLAKKLNVPFSCNYYSYYLSYDKHDFWFELPNEKICSKCSYQEDSIYSGKCHLFNGIKYSDNNYNYVAEHKVPEGCPYELEISVS